MLLGLGKLRELYFDNNHLQSIDDKAFSNANNIINIQMENNDLTFSQMGSPFQQLHDLQIINLRNNSIMAIPEDWNYVLANLRDVDLSHNRIQSLSIGDLRFRSSNINLNLSHNIIQEIELSTIEIVSMADSEIQAASQDCKVYLSNNPLRCDCILMHFVQFLRKEIGKTAKNLQIIPGQLQCAGPTSMAGRYVADIHPKELLCNLDSPNSSIKKCPQNCTCSVRTWDSALIMNCSNAQLTAVPDLPNPRSMGLKFIELYVENNRLHTLPIVNMANKTHGYNYVAQIYAANNNITDLLLENLPENLTVLNMVRNKLSVLNETVLSSLNHTSMESLSLGDNPWRCDCESREFLQFTQVYFKKIADLNDIKCSDGSILHKHGDLCPEDQTVVIVLSVLFAMFGLLVGILAALYYKYQQEIKVWLFAHNLCTWFVTEYEVDKNKKYDAFVSYSHKDVDFVTEQIVPELENGPVPFKLCLHDRDWIVGCGITQSVSSLKKVIICFLSSHI